MKDNNIRKSYLSCSSPGNVLSPAPSDLPAGIALTKRFNNYLSTLKKTHPQQFGFFASLPLPSIPDALAEIGRALDDLHADGFVLLSSAYGFYLGDPKLAPVYAKLNARNAVLFIHPTIPCPINTPLSVSGTPRLNYVAPLMNAYQAPTLEFIFDTTRTLSDLILTGTSALYSSIKWLIPHCGSALPSLLDRFITASKILGPKPGSDRKVMSSDIQNVTQLLNKNFWFDLAGFPMNNQIYNMRQFLGAGAAGRFTYGSDVQGGGGGAGGDY
jgi:6-methylsalicylate decarboxylase